MVRVPFDISFTSKSKRGAPTINYGPIAYYTRGLPFPSEKLKVLRPDRVRYVEITGKHDVSPHVDVGQTVALNCYFQAGNAFIECRWNDNPKVTDTKGIWTG